MAVKNTSGKRLIQSVVRTLNILNCFEKNEDLQISQISSLVGINKSTAYHLLFTLKEMQFVRQDEYTKGYLITFTTSWTNLMLRPSWKNAL